MGEAAGNATKAAILAGYSKKTAQPQSSRLLSKAMIRAAIEERQSQDTLVADRTERQRFWTGVMRNAGEPIVARLKASELLGKAGADFVEKHEHSGPDGAAIPTRLVIEWQQEPSKG